MRWLSRWRHLPNKHGALSQILRTHIRVGEKQCHSIPRPPYAPWCKNPRTRQVHTPQQSHEFSYKDRTLPLPAPTLLLSPLSREGRKHFLHSSLCVNVVILSSWVPRETLTGWAGLLWRSQVAWVFEHNQAGTSLGACGWQWPDLFCVLI